MCNYLHEDSKPIDEDGIGYKVFSKIYGEYKTAFLANDYLNIYSEIVDPRKEKIIWNNDKYEDTGFCFFISKEEALRFLNNPNTISRYFVLAEIKYNKGLGKHQEDRIQASERYETGLCKEFIVSKEISY